jgi:hypothetical protein
MYSFKLRYLDLVVRDFLNLRYLKLKDSLGYFYGLLYDNSVTIWCFSYYHTVNDANADY